MTKASTSTDILPPVLYGLRKTHKTVENPTIGPKVRPVCAANIAPNSRLSHFLSMIINDFMDAENHDGEVRSSEEMRAKFEAFNSLENIDKRFVRILSMDVKALYPSMSRSESRKAIIEMIVNSGVSVENVDFEEATKFIVVMYSQDDIELYGLSDVIPTRAKVTTRKLT